jgi:hypothetical protein
MRKCAYTIVQWIIIQTWIICGYLMHWIWLLIMCGMYLTISLWMCTYLHYYVVHYYVVLQTVNFSKQNDIHHQLIGIAHSICYLKKMVVQQEYCLSTLNTLKIMSVPVKVMDKMLDENVTIHNRVIYVNNKSYSMYNWLVYWLYLPVS